MNAIRMNAIRMNDARTDESREQASERHPTSGKSRTSGESRTAPGSLAPEQEPKHQIDGSVWMRGRRCGSARSECWNSASSNSP